MFFSDMSQHYDRKEKEALPEKLNYSHLACQERISLFISGQASLTVEAACVLPLFLYVVLAFMYFFAVIGVAGAVSAGIQETGKELAVYAYALQSFRGENSSEVRQLATGSLSAAYAKRKIVDKINEMGTNTTVLRNGVNGIRLAGSSFLEEGDIIDLVVHYQLKFPIPVLTLKAIPVVQRGYFRAWTGRDNGIGNAENTDGDNQVYVTVNGSVYHKDENCTHIRLSIQKVYTSNLVNLRNQGGGKYYPCENCGSGSGGKVYITDTGDRYHNSLTCSGLKRQVIKVPLSQVESWAPCSRCGG